MSTFPFSIRRVASKRAATLGTDLNSEPVRTEAIRRAREGNLMATAQGIQLRNPISGQRDGFIALIPIYRHDAELNSVDERRRNTRGVIVGAFQIVAVLDGILARTTLPQDVDLYLYPAHSGPDAMPVYLRGAASREQPLQGEPQQALAGLPSWTTVLRAGDARWNLVVVPMQSGLISYYRAWLVLAAVVLVFGALLAYMWASMRHALRLEAANTRVLELAQTDLLTSLANRRAFLKRLTMAFAASLRGAPPFAVLYLDIDNFKDVNDTLGHAMGDLLLKEVVGRLQTAVRTEDLVARFGGDEFAILLPAVTDPETAGELAARIGKLLAVPFTIKGHKVRITSSIGIALFSPETASPEAMMMQADLALYGAKDEGRDCFRFHSHDLDREVHERVRVAEELRVALDRGELELYYQPQVELATGRIIGLEALIRWNHETRGLLTPASFIPIAERTGLVLPIGHWVFEEACSQLKLWRAEGIAPQVLSVNVSGVQFKGASELEREIEASLTRWNIDPTHLELELTELVLMEATHRHSNTLEKLRQLGHQDLDRRFRHRLFVAQISDAIPGQPAQARAGIRVPSHGRLSQRRRGQGRYPPRQRAWPRGHRRRRGDRGASALPDGRRLRAGARLLFQPAGAGRPSRGIAAGRADRAANGSVAAAHLGGVSAALSPSHRIQRSLPRRASRRRRLRLVGRGP